MSELDQARTASADVGGEQAAPAAPEFSIADLQNLRAIVDLAAKRGAFSAAEMSAVGQVFDRLNAFLNAVAPQQPAQPAEGDEQAPAA